jgi:hypothetical protein
VVDGGSGVDRRMMLSRRGRIRCRLAITMTRPNQKDSERRTLDAVLAALGVRPDQEPDEGETPDFTLLLSDRTIGVEITMYRSGATVEDGTGRRQVENEWELLKAASDRFRSQHSEIRDINVRLMFAASVLPRRQHAEFIAEIATFVGDHASELSSHDLTFWPPSFTAPLMRTFLRTLSLRTDRFAEWHSNLAAGYVARPDQTIADIVAEKSGKRFRPADELWLAIQCGTRISEMMLDIEGVEDFGSVPSLDPFVFSRVFVLAFTGAYEWTRGAGWRKLTGENVESSGPSFDELKGVLNDPEWLADPNGKAIKVAMECLAEMRGQRPEHRPAIEGEADKVSTLQGNGGKANSHAWIDDGEKYALVGLSVKIDGHISASKITPHLWVLADTKFEIPPQWREWLGSIRAKEVESCNLFLLSKMASMTPDVLDAENQKLQQRVSNFYVGLLLASTFAPAHGPVMLSGSRRNGEIGLRQQHDFESPIPCIFRPYPSVLARDIQLAAQLAGQIEALGTAQLKGGHWRLFRTLDIYRETRTVPDILDRLHQYARCIDGLILADIGKTRQQFKSRTELCIGPRHHDMMGEIYDVRSAVEHLHESRYLEGFDREIRLDLLKKEGIAERIARTALARILGDSNLWAHFANTSSLATFWALPKADRRRIWGDPINPLDALADFDPQFIHDGLLGAP